MAAWENWSGNVRCTPAHVVAAASEEEVVDAVRAAARDGLTLRPAGSRHSFTPLCATDGVALDLHGLAGVEHIDGATGRVTVRGGTRLSALGAPLRAAGLALHNQGDVDTQTITGAIGTGTHGTGPTLGNLSTAVVGVRLVTADGDVLECSAAQRPDVYEAARLSLGALGVITAVTLQAVPAYNLHERIWFEAGERALDDLDARVAATRHYEFFWYPARDLCEHKALDATDAAPDALPDLKRERIDESWRVFPSARDLRFNEMEYSVPASSGPECFDEIRTLMLRDFPDVQWPVEYRTLAADDVWCSPAHGRPTVTISIHEDAARPYDMLFAACEGVFRRYDGRPHWGKVHAWIRADAAATLPRFDDFRRVCAEVDPDGRFRNDHLHALLS
ncbi:MAG TPA: D-arabinono-1,4-lactone oxidase [Acidimicrobiia bacterium]|nr:D-arabinono-1,4-lactone oxidase [Acidimicrobiia bacterium]